jgi:2-oxoisovalerate dehydrogenase E1 component alpha subunit
MVRAHESRKPPAADTLHRQMYRDMLRSRELSDRMFALNRQGRAAFAVTGQGHEATQVGSAYAIKRGTDWVLPYYRDVGVMIALGMTPHDILLGLFAKAEDPSSGGRQMPSHWSWPEARVVTRSSVIAANLTHAAGIAYASKLRGLEEVTIAYFGEGATSEGEFHEAVNFAAIHRLPAVFFCENNGYAISESQEKQMSVMHVADRARGYDIVGQTVDGNDVLAVHQTAKWSIEECRRGHGPKLIEAKTYRLSPHTSSDDDRRYRTRAELEEWIKKDPIDRFRKRLIEEGDLTEAEDFALRAEAKQEIVDAVKSAEAAPDPAPEDALRHVFYEGEG